MCLCQYITKWKKVPFSGIHNYYTVLQLWVVKGPQKIVDKINQNNPYWAKSFFFWGGLNSFKMYCFAPILYTLSEDKHREIQLMGLPILIKLS